MKCLTLPGLALLAFGTVAEPFHIDAPTQDAPSARSGATPDLAARVAALEGRVAALEDARTREPGESMARARERWREAVAQLEAAEIDWQEDLLVGEGATSEAVAQNLALQRQALAAGVATLRAEYALLGTKHQDLVAEHGALPDEVAVVEAASGGNRPTAQPSAQKILLGEQIAWAEARLERLPDELAARESELAAIDVRLREAMAASQRSARLSRALREAERRREHALEGLLAAEGAAARR